MNGKGFIGFIIILLPMIIGYGVTGSFGGASLIWIACFVVFIGISVLYSKTKAGKKKAEEMVAKQKELKSLVSFDKKTNTLTLHKRSPLIREIIKIEESHDITISHEPEKLHIGAVTVGGVTTGGTYTTGGYDYISASKKNGLCHMVHVPTGEYIVNIQLSEIMFREATYSVITQYLDHEKRQIFVDVESSPKKDWAILNWMAGKN